MSIRGCMLQRIFRSGFSLLSFLLFFPATVLSLTIDKFDGDQVAEAIGPGNVAFSVLSSSGAIGGTRTMRAEVDAASDPGTLRVRSIFGRASHSQDALVTGNSLFTWDGDTNVSTVDSTGLGGIDFTQDSADALRLHIISYDFPSSQPVDIVFTVYDASDPSANTYSQATLTLNQIVSDQFFEVPFASFTTHGPSGAVDFTQVGAVTLFVDGQASDIDLTFEWFGTNGECVNLVPDSNGRVIDECGVCGGDDSTCADCLGVPNGNTGPGSSCTSSLPGICSEGSFDQQCVCISDTTPMPEMCDGIDNDCDGEVDETFPDLGSECLIGQGACESSGTYVCSESKELMCDAVMVQLDECLEPEGCDGVPGSSLELDACGVCGGDGTSCLDCSGEPNGTDVIDRCGVCGGDGFSCIDCEATDIGSLLKALDGGAKKQERLIKRSIQRLLRVDTTKAQRKQARKIAKEAHALQVENWTLSWTIDRESVQCSDAVVVCVSTSTTGITSQYRENSERLRDLGMEVLRLYYEATNKELRRLGKRHDRRHDTNMELADQVPLEQYSCDL